MTKTKIKIVSIGYIPYQLDEKIITRWKSDLFEINSQIDKHYIKSDSDSEEWQYSDSVIENELPKRFDEDLLIGIVNVPLESGYYARRFKGNRICFTFHEIATILRNENQKLENYIIRNIYRYTLVYRMYENRIPAQFENIKFTHDDTRRCIFDANGIKTDIVYSLENPIICKKCVTKLNHHQISNDELMHVSRELKKIKKGSYYRIGDFIKNHPILSLIISTMFGILLSISSAFMYDFLKLFLN